MQWKLLSKDEIASEYPRQTTPILAAVAEIDDEGTLWADTCFVLYADGIVQIPHLELPLEDMTVVYGMLRGAVVAH
jgi:hypothetical protein